MEQFIYGFGVKKFPLTNPSANPDNLDYLIFNIPQDVGFIFTVCEPKDLPSIRALMGRKGLRRLGFLYFF